METKSLKVEAAQIDKAVKALRQVKKAAAKNLLLNDEEHVQLQFSYKTVPKTKRKSIKIVLPHPMSSSSDVTVCLFVKDLTKVREYEKTVKKYKDIFASAGITQDIEIFPLKKLKLEYGDFEAKRNLSNAYDIFLADARIIRLLPALLGKHFVARNKFPTQVRLNTKDLKSEITNAMSTSKCELSGKGSTCQVIVGSLASSDSELSSNISAVISTLEKEVSGGASNIRNIVIKTVNSKAVPVYLSIS